ncbi:hypothetical protein M422DRAFT_38001 [Sphaerobolus stellatus SS14]|uniref:Serine aminopeptidase S33 domain-containing protein n=1 Tax=Sphaerobolus stellatus (strain SS14) TaxID=990650 RepID=A0A0C9TYN3_SPHS4|nr:hypothetical protein M422DRAFT_38001 [Sphaerobolus stellatus SS14]
MSTDPTLGTFFTVFVQPFLSAIGLYTPSDPTYGRYLISTPDSELELASRTANGVQVKTRMRRIFVDDLGKGKEAEDVQLISEELSTGKGREWVFYKVWERVDARAMKGRGRGSDVLLLHGINDYGGKWALHMDRLLEQGFRVVVPDLPSHGRSTGLHAYITSPAQLFQAIDVVLNDINLLDDDSKRNIFLVGSSMGGGMALSYAALHSNSSRITGVYAMCPMIGVAPETMPPPIVQLVGKVLSPILGRLPLATAVRGKGHHDPRVEAEFMADPRHYRGKLRISTGFALLRCMLNLMPPPHTFRTPFRISHGTHDRVTSSKLSEAFVAACKADAKSLDESRDQELVLFSKYEHIMLKVGVDEEDDEMRQRILKDMVEWLLKRV